MVALSPSESADPMVQFRWRRAVAVTLLMVVLGSLGSLAWAQGWIPGMSGVALASDVADLKRQLSWQVNSIRDKQALDEALTLETVILEQRTNECQAENGKPPNDLAARYALERLHDYLNQYRRLTGYQYPNLPTCDELVLR